MKYYKYFIVILTQRKNIKNALNKTNNKGRIFYFVNSQKKFKLLNNHKIENCVINVIFYLNFYPFLNFSAISI